MVNYNLHIHFVYLDPEQEMVARRHCFAPSGTGSDSDDHGDVVDLDHTRTLGM